MANLGIIGTGDIFDRYVQGLRRFPGVRITRCADIDLGRAEEAAARAGGIAFGPPADVLGAGDVDVVVILTPPATHAQVIDDALDAGKHVYVEKPLAASAGDGVRLVAKARAAGLQLGSAPDTFLGSACQTARAMIDAGEIGEVFGAAAFMTHHRVETRHPDPTFFFQPGGGPLLDLGPYYMTQIVNCLGPLADIAGQATIGHKTRTVTAPNRRVDSIDVNVPTHTTAVGRFQSGATLTLIMSFDVFTRSVPFIEIYGTRGQIQVPDPNTFDGGVVVFWNDDNQGRYVPPVFPPLGRPTRRDQLLRGIGVADLADAVGSGRTPRTDAQLALHVLEVLSAVETSAATRSVVAIENSCQRPDPLTAEEIARWAGPAA